MVYGKLDVYWPDGPIESYQLEKPSVAIGRSTGNDIVFDTTAVSRYHLSITRQDQQVLLEDLESVNGTYIDGQRIKAHEPIVLHGGEEIQIGDIRVIYRPEDEDDMPTRPMSLPDQQIETRRIEVAQTTFRVELEPPPDPVTPGAYVQANLVITNLGNTPDHYRVEVDGVPKEWVRVDRTHIDLEPGGDSTVMISFKPLRRSESVPGDYPVTIRVHAQSVPETPIEARMRLILRSYSGFGMVLGTERITPDQPFELHVHNQGNGPLTINFSGAAPRGGLSFDIQPSGVTLAPGERRAIRGYVRPTQKTLIGSARERHFDLLARAQDASGFLVGVPGVLVEKPDLPLWVPTLIIPALLIGLILVVIFGMTLLNRPRTPTLSMLTASALRVFEGDTITLSWTVTDASQVDVRLDGGQPIMVNPPLNTYKQVMADSGDHVLTVEALNGDQVVQQAVHISVSKPLKINAFEVAPNPLLRNVWQQITIRWNVDGAQSVHFEGIEALTGKPDPNAYGPVDSTVVQGTPRDTVELKLVAQGDGGTSVTQPVRVEIKNPVCKVNADNTGVRGGPGLNYLVNATLNKSAEVSPDGRDQTGQWIHLIPAPDLQAWLSINDVTCADFKPGDLTTIAVLPPTPLPPTIIVIIPPTVVSTQPVATALPTTAATIKPTAVEVRK